MNPFISYYQWTPSVKYDYVQEEKWILIQSRVVAVDETSSSFYHFINGNGLKSDTKPQDIIQQRKLD